MSVSQPPPDAQALLKRRGSGGISAGVGAALQELDRLVTRPSVEYTIETENPVHQREDDTDGE